MISADSSSVADSILSHVIHSLKETILDLDDVDNLQEFLYFDSYMSRSWACDVHIEHLNRRNVDFCPNKILPSRNRK